MMGEPDTNRETLTVAAALLAALACAMVGLDLVNNALRWWSVVAGGCAVMAALGLATLRPPRGLSLLALGVGSSAVAAVIALRAYPRIADATDAAASVEAWQALTIRGLLTILVVLCATVDVRWGAAAGLPPLAAAVLTWGLLERSARVEMLEPFLRSTGWLLAGWAIGVAASFSFRRSRLGALNRGQLGRYILEDRVGGGGMGEVHRARHMALDRPAAVKIVKAELGHGSSATETTPTELLAREAIVTATLRSPHTVELYDYGVAADDTLYYVMEYLEGLNLRQLVERFGPQPPGRVVRILLQACESLAEAHEAKLVHRDVKPANILLCRLAASADFVKVLDFGLTRSTSEKRNDDGATGTPAYMAPEITAAPGRIDGRADIYSLGCVAYWMLTGETVFDAEDVAEAVVQHVREQPVAPSERSELEVPADLEEIVLRCLEKDPEDRFETIGDLADRLAACSCASDWTDDDADGWWDLHFPQEGRRTEVADKLADVDDKAPMLSGS